MPLSWSVPIDRRHALAAGLLLPERCTGAALMADLSGFTRFTDTLASELGPRRGAEALMAHLEPVYAALIAEVHRFGGTVLSFAGDALVCWFDEESCPRAGRAAAAPRAVAAALAMHRRMEPLRQPASDAGPALRLELKTALAYGPARRLLVGAPEIATLDALVGPALERVEEAARRTSSGETVVDATLRALLGDGLVLSAQREAGAAVVRGLRREPEPAPWGTGAARAPSEEASLDTAFDAPLDAALEERATAPFTHAALRARVRAGEAPAGELRLVCALFCSFEGLDYERDPLAMHRLRALVGWAQATVTRYGGFLHSMTAGDKGTYLYVVFGAPVAHDDDPRRAAAAALALAAPPPELGFDPRLRIGISRGRVLTGLCGGVGRHHYAVVGTEVNVAARLMSHAGAGEVLLSSRMAADCRAGFRVRAVGALPIKGRREPLATFALEASPERHPGAASMLRDATVIVGRSSEVAELNHLVERALGGERCVCHIEGEPGIGKTRLAQELLERAAARGALCLHGAGDSMLTGSPYRAWREALLGLLGCSQLSLDDPGALQAAVLAALEGADEELLERLPLLDGVLPLDLPDTELTRWMTGEVRGQNTLTLLVDLLAFSRARAPRRAASSESVAALGSDAPLLLVLDDAQWADASSWRLAERVWRQLPGVLVVFLSRPLREYADDAAVPDSCRQILQGSETRRVEVGRLSRAAIAELVGAVLGVATVPSVVLDFIHARAEGQPLFSAELARALRESGALAVEAGACRLRDAADALASVDFPDSVEGVVTSRIDRLPPGHQRLLKVASAIGDVFDVETLMAVSPNDLTEAERDRVLEELTELALVRPTGGAEAVSKVGQLDPSADVSSAESLNVVGADGAIVSKRVAGVAGVVDGHGGATQGRAYRFQHVVTRQVAYSLMLYAQRRELHRAVARTLEERHAASLAGVSAVLAHHWEHAEQLERAADSYGQAGTQALADGAFREALVFLERALRLAPATVLARHRAHWSAGIAEAAYRVGDLVKSRGAGERALAALDRSVPRGPGLGTALLAEVARQVARRRGAAPAPAAEQERDDLRVAARLYGTLTEVCYLGGALVSSTYTALRQVNVAERVGTSAELQEAYGVVAVIAGLVGRHTWAELYGGLSWRMAEELAAPPAQAMVRHQLSLYYAAIGDFARVRDYEEHAAAIFGRLGNTGRLRDALGLHGTTEYLASRWDSAQRLLESLLATERATERFVQQIWGVGWLGAIALQRGDLAVAKGRLEQAVALLDKNTVGLMEVALTGLLALACERAGDHRRALELAERAHRLIAKTGGRPAGHIALDGYVAVAELYGGWADGAGGSGGSERRAASRRADETVRFLGVYARGFPIGASAHAFYRGRALARRGKLTHAVEAWQRAAREAARFGMTHEQGRAHLELAQRGPEGEAAAHARAAIVCFEALGARPLLEQAQALRGSIARGSTGQGSMDRGGVDRGGMDRGGMER